MYVFPVEKVHSLFMSSRFLISVPAAPPVGDIFKRHKGIDVIVFTYIITHLLCHVSRKYGPLDGYRLFSYWQCE